MKIQCDVCNADEASVFCSADEAALCAACDRRVHHANKLAVKHPRFSLLRPENERPPLCDICQERRAFLFCQQDRALLCRDCDLPIHSANHLTQNHNRFLLTGVKLSSPITAADHNPSTLLTDSNSKTHDHKPKTTVSAASELSYPIAPESESVASMAGTTNISEYLMEILPGWQVEDLLDTPSYTPFGFSKGGGDDAFSPFLDAAADAERSLGSFSTESLGIWVPQAPPNPQVPHYFSQTGGVQIGRVKNLKNSSSVGANQTWRDDAFTVPQISPPSTGCWRSRRF